MTKNRNRETLDIDKTKTFKKALDTQLSTLAQNVSK